MKSKLLLLSAVSLVLAVPCAGRANADAQAGDTPAPAPSVSVPASQAYFEPNYDPNGVNISADNGITGWSDPSVHIVWYGHVSTPGALVAAVSLNIPVADAVSLKLTVGEQTRDANSDDIGRGTSVTAKATGTDTGSPVSVVFPDVKLKSPGTYRFVLSGVHRSGTTFGDVKSLTLSGQASNGADFSVSQRRACAYLTYWYQAPKNTNISWYYNEAKGLTDPISSYYCACGFARGYFGMQVNGPHERRIIFSVWNAGKEPKDPSKVQAEDKVTLIAKGDGVFTGEFGNEGTGGHSHLVYNWKTGDVYRFLVSAQPDGDGTIYSGYFYFPEKQAWGLISSWRAPKDGGYLRGLYSFNEDFNPANGFQKRYAEYGNGWVRSDAGEWTELTTASYAVSFDGSKERTDRQAGIENGRFYLSNGGYFAPLVGNVGDKLTRPATAVIPVDSLPTPPMASSPQPAPARPAAG
jgi:hypothetical protein